MKLVAIPLVTLVTLCAPAIADPPPAALKIHFAVRDATTHDFDVVVDGHSRCATASDHRADHDIQLKACLIGAASLEVEWYIRGAWGEYRTTSSVAAARGATTELGTANGPRLAVTVQ